MINGDNCGIYLSTFILHWEVPEKFQSRNSVDRSPRPQYSSGTAYSSLEEHYETGMEIA